MSNADIKILDMNDPDFEQQLMDALGVHAGDTIEVSGPQFDRTDGKEIFIPQDSWPILDTLPADTLKELGCQAWDEPDENGKVLMLFPAEWYDYIPDGMEVVTISGRTERFTHGETDNDRRFGALAYGVKVKASPNQQAAQD